MKNIQSSFEIVFIGSWVLFSNMQLQLSLKQTYMLEEVTLI